MDYIKPQSDNLLNDFFRRQTDFMSLAEDLLAAENSRDFTTLLDRLKSIDKRSLYLFLCDNKYKIKPKYLEIASKRLRMPII